MKQLFLVSFFRHHLSLLVLAGVLCLLAFSSARAQTIRYVKPDGSGNGSSWATASANLQAIINASSAGDQVWVAAGTYKPSSCTTCSATDRMMSFSMKNGVALYGGFSGTETALSERPASISLAQPSSTTLSGDLGTPNDYNDNSVHVIINNDLNNTAVLDGFVITGGNIIAEGIGVDYNTLQGGGMRNLHSSPTIHNCFFLDNTGSFSRRGSGLYSDATSFPKLTNCTFERNRSSEGAAIYGDSISLTNCYFNNNYSSGYSTVIITKTALVSNCNFNNNSGGIGSSGGANGGALSVGEGSVIKNCLFTSNDGAYGGALSSYRSTITNCTFRGNLAYGYFTARPFAYGGAVYDGGSTFSNCTFSNNEADGRIRSGGGAVLAGPTTSFVNCSFAGNKCNRPGGAIVGTAKLVNCIIWGNTPDGISSDSTIAMTYTDTQDNTPGTGNFSLDPLFVDVAGDNLRLRACSPAIDKGNNAANSATTDLNNSPRLVRQIDLGAYEFQGTPQSPLTITQQPVSYFSIPQGGTFTANVNASGSVSAYQWYKDGAPISGATSATLSISNLSASNQGRYYVVVTGNCNSVTSNEIVLIVNTGMYTVKAGRWDDASVWSMNRVPVSGDAVRIKHPVTVPNNYIAQARQLSYDPGQTVQLQTGSKLVAK
jgi:hypothetical protein